MLSTLDKSNKYIWGTGRNCHIFLDKLELYLTSPLVEYQSEWESDIKGFIDISEDKIGTCVRGKRVVGPDEALADMDFCIITIADNATVIKLLKDNGFVEGQWILWDEYLTECRNRAIYNKHTLLRNLNNQLSVLVNNYEILKRTSLEEMQATNKSIIIASLEWYYGGDIATVHSLVNGKIKNNKNKTIKTIGIVIDRLYGGGIEKVVSLLLEGLERLGYRIILLTDPSVEKKEKYKNADVFYFAEKGGSFSSSRLNDLEMAINKYGIDIICFHTGYARLDTYYEVILAKMLGVYVTMEIHSAFLALLKDQLSVSSQFVYMYSMVDRLITVSETDDCFWRSLGCKSILVENPIETFGVSEKMKRFSDKKYFEVLWVGRIVQQPKRVLDAVDIIKLVNDKLGNVRLHIIGMKDDEKVYRQLVEKTRNIADYVVIDEFQKDIKSAYHNADIVLLTSASESFSNVLAEAKVFARPVVMYELPWLRLSYDKTGVWSVKQRDVISAAEAIICLLEDEMLWEEYSNDAWNAIQMDMNRDVIKEWVDIFQGLEKGIEVEDEHNMGVSNVIKLLLDQMYGKGYPDY